MKCCLCILLLFVFVSSPAAESGPVQSSITGIVTGPDGARIPGVTITARTGNEAAVQVVSNSHGMYRMPQLAPGRYFVSAELEGFETAVVSDLLVSEGSSRTLDLNLQLATVKQVLSVISYAPRTRSNRPTRGKARLATWVKPWRPKQAYGKSERELSQTTSSFEASRAKT